MIMNLKLKNMKNMMKYFLKKYVFVKNILIGYLLII